MDIIKCTDKDIDYMYDNWALCFEGTTTNDDNMNFLIQWLGKYDCKLVPEQVFVITGKQMNEKYHLTGDNAYQDDLTIVCIRQEDLSNVGAIIIPRFQIGGRWFTDVVDNNAARE